MLVNILVTCKLYDISLDSARYIKTIDIVSKRIIRWSKKAKVAQKPERDCNQKLTFVNKNVEMDLCQKVSKVRKHKKVFHDREP